MIYINELIYKMESIGYMFYNPTSNPDKCIKYADGDTFYTFSISDNSAKLAIDLISLELDCRGDILQRRPQNNEKTITIAGIYTDPKFRRKGLANKITNDFTSVCKSLSISINLEPSQMRNYARKGEKCLANKQLSDWYKRKGFKRKFEGRDGILIKS